MNETFLMPYMIMTRMSDLIPIVYDPKIHEKYFSLEFGMIDGSNY
jgi:hypothetical protein